MMGTARITVAYWSLWTLACLLYLDNRLATVADLLWLTPVLLWLTVFRVTPVLELPDGARTLGVCLATFALGIVARETYATLLDMASAFFWNYEVRWLRLASVPTQIAISAVALSLLLAVPVAWTLGGPGVALLCGILLTGWLYESADSLLSWSRWSTRTSNNVFMLIQIFAVPLVFYAASRLALSSGQRRRTPALMECLAAGRHYWRGQTSNVRIDLIYFAGVIAAYALLLWRGQDLGSLSDRAGHQGLQILSWWLILFLLVAVSVPAWRSVRRHARGAMLRARAGITFLALPIIALTLLWEGPHIGFNLGIVAQHTLGTPWRFRLDDEDSTVLLVRGDVAPGLTDSLKAALHRHPYVKTLDLSSPGGWTDEAQRAAELIREKGLSTRVTGSCASACTLLFAAGATRHLGENGQLGLHGSRSASSLVGNPAADNSQLIETYARFGIDRSFLARGFAVPFHDIWHPTHAELASAGFVTAIADE